MTGDYWGTEDEALIAEWIDDHLDHPDHPNYRMVVDFVPYHGDPVRVEPRSLSQVRGSSTEAPLLTITSSVLGRRGSVA